MVKEVFAEAVCYVLYTYIAYSLCMLYTVYVYSIQRLRRGCILYVCYILYTIYAEAVRVETPYTLYTTY